VSFNFRANEWNLHQLDLFLEKPLAADAEGWAVGGRFDFMFGTDTPYTQAAGHWDSRLVNDNSFRFYKIALPQAYADIHAPLGDGLSARVGHLLNHRLRIRRLAAEFFLLAFLQHEILAVYPHRNFAVLSNGGYGHVLFVGGDRPG